MEGFNEESIDNYFPNIETLGVNSIISCLEYFDDMLVPRTAMDLLLAHLPLHVPFLGK